MEEQQVTPNEAFERVRASIHPEELRAQVENICRSDAFDGKANAQKVLRYLVRRAMERHVPTDREIAVQALNNKRRTGPAHARAEMKTLRRVLAEYYEQEATEDAIWLDIPKGQYNVFWRHSPKTLLGRTEFAGWVLWSAKLTADDAKRAADTARKFWPHLESVFPVYCAEAFNAELDNGKITLPETVKMFFDSIGNHHLFITSFDRSEIRIYPLNVWLEEWARIKSSERPKSDLTVYEFWGKSATIDGKAGISIHSKLLDALNVPIDRPFSIELSFHPDGFIYFEVPKPPPRPIGKYNLLLLSYAPDEAQKSYYYILVEADKEKELNEALAGTKTFSLKSYGMILESGEGDPPEGTKERLLTKYDAILDRDSPA